MVLREVPDEPDVVERLKAAHGVGVAELRLEVHHALQRVDEAGLARYAELHGVGRLDVGDGADEVCAVECFFLHVAPNACRGGCGAAVAAGG